MNNQKLTKKEKIIVVVTGIIFVLIISAVAFKTTPEPLSEQNIKVDQSIQPETEQPEQNKAMRILQEQKERAEETTRTAVNLLTKNEMTEVVNLYKDRWDEIAQLRVDIMYDEELTDLEKNNINQVLQVEQESITEILSELEY